MTLREFARGRVAVAPYRNGIMLIIRKEGEEDKRILLNSSKFSPKDRELIRSGRLEEFILLRGNHSVVLSEGGGFYYLVPPTRITDINPDWGKAGPPQKPWWEDMFEDDDEGPQVPF